MQSFGVPFSQQRHSFSGGIPGNPPTPVRMAPPQGAPSASSNVGLPRAKMDRNVSLNNLQVLTSSAGLRKSMSTDRLDLLQGKASSSPRVEGASPGPKPTAATKRGSSTGASTTQIRTSSTNLGTPTSTATGSNQADQSGQRSLVVSRTPPRQPQPANTVTTPRRNSSSSGNNTPRAPVAPEDIGHFVGTIGDSIDRSAQYPRGRYCIVKKLGAGVYGKVLEVEDRKYNARVAIKIIRREPPVYREAVKKEIKVLLELDGMFGTLKMLRTFEHQGHVCLSLELLGIPLQDRVRDTGGLPLDDIRDIGLQLYHAMEYVHKRGIIHTDIKPDNILVARDKNADGTSAIRVKMVDFGSAISRGEWHPPLIGTLEYRAPESVLQASYNQLVDVWAIGCVLVELLTSKVLFRGASRQDTEGHLLLLMEQVLQQRLPEALVRKGAANRNAHNAPFMRANAYGQPAIARILKKGALPYQTVRSLVKDPELLDLTLNTMRMEPEKRWTAAQAKQHAFFKNSLLDATSVDEFGHLKSHARRAAAIAAEEEASAKEKQASAETKAEQVRQAAIASPQTPVVAAVPAPKPEKHMETAKEPEKERPVTLDTTVTEPEAVPAQADTPETVTSRVESPETEVTKDTLAAEAAPSRFKLLPAEAPEGGDADVAVELSPQKADAGVVQPLSTENLRDMTQRTSVEQSLHASMRSTSTVSVENIAYDDLHGDTTTPRKVGSTTPRKVGSANSSPPTLSPERTGVRTIEFAEEKGRTHTVEVYSRRLSGDAGNSGAMSGGAAPAQMPPPSSTSPTRQREGGEGNAGANEEHLVMTRTAIANLLANNAEVMQKVSERNGMRSSGEFNDSASARTVRVGSQDYNSTFASSQKSQAPLPPLGASLDAPRVPMGESMDGAPRRYSAVTPPPPSRAAPPLPPSSSEVRPPSSSTYPRSSSVSVGQVSQARDAASSSVLQVRTSLLDYHSRRIEDLDMRLRDNAAKRATAQNQSGSSGASGSVDLSVQTQQAEGTLRENINANGQPSPTKIQPSSPKVENAESGQYGSSSLLRTQLRHGSLSKKGEEGWKEGSNVVEQTLRQAVSRAGGGVGEVDGGDRRTWSQSQVMESEVEHKLRSLRQFINEAMQEGLHKEGGSGDSKAAAQQKQPADEVGSSLESAVSTVWLGDEERKVDADGRVLGEGANVYLL